MKILTRIILIFFVFFQFSSSIMYLIEADKETKITMVLDEEENSKEESKEIKEFKTEFFFSTPVEVFSFFALKNKNFTSFYLLKKYSKYSKLAILPPELI